MIRLAIISFEHVHAPHYLQGLKEIDGVSVAAVAEPEDRRLEAHSSLLQGIPRYTDYKRMIEAEDLDGVIVCSANSRHKEIVIECARAGLPVLCEKPIATRTADAREMLAVCQAHDSALVICFPTRFSPALHQAREVLRQGSLGKPLAVSATNRGMMPGDWFVDPELAGGGALMDHTVHVADALRWLFEAEFTRVFAHAATRLHQTPVEDVGLVTLEMSNEVFVTVDTSWSRPNRSFPLWGDLCMRIVGTEGVLDVDVVPWTLNQYSEEAGKHLVTARDGDLNIRLLTAFVQSLSGQSTLLANGVDGLRALEVVEAAYKSLESRNPVAL
ncbi:MAG: Gfo/Idh/MocA family oxidoreductase [Acidobacteriota bacterium]